MARDPGEWYEEKHREAERLAAELAGARAVLEALEGIKGAARVGERMHSAASDVVRRLERKLWYAANVGD